MRDYFASENRTWGTHIFTLTRHWSLYHVRKLPRHPFAPSLLRPFPTPLPAIPLRILSYPSPSLECPKEVDSLYSGWESEEKLKREKVKGERQREREKDPREKRDKWREREEWRETGWRVKRKREAIYREGIKGKSKWRGEREREWRESVREKE